MHNKRIGRDDLLKIEVSVTIPEAAIRNLTTTVGPNSSIGILALRLWPGS